MSSVTGDAGAFVLERRIFLAADQVTAVGLRRHKPRWRGMTHGRVIVVVVEASQCIDDSKRSHSFDFQFLLLKYDANFMKSIQSIRNVQSIT